MASIPKECAYIQGAPIVSRVNWRNCQQERANAQKGPQFGLATSVSPGSLAYSAHDAPIYLDENSADTIARIELDYWGLPPSRKMVLLLVLPPALYLTLLVLTPLFGTLFFSCIGAWPFLVWSRFVRRSIRVRALELDSQLKKEALKRVRQILFWYPVRWKDAMRIRELRKSKSLSLREAQVAMLKEYLLKEFKVQELPSRLS